MRTKLAICLILFSGLLLMGCGGIKPMYYYGDYSKTFYHYTKEQNDKTLNEHKQELEKVITESEKKNLPVPPGIYAELGYINLESNNTKEAIRLFQAEMSLYPESKILMERLINTAQTRNNEKS